jgi:hypothetical protein
MISGIVTCNKLHDNIAYLGDALAEHGTGCPLCQAIEVARRFKYEAEKIRGGEIKNNNSAVALYLENLIDSWHIHTDQAKLHFIREAIKRLAPVQTPLLPNKGINLDSPRLPTSTGYVCPACGKPSGDLS